MQFMFEAARAKYTIDGPFRLGGRASDLAALRDQIDAVLARQDREYDYAWISIADTPSSAAKTPHSHPGFQ
jgi:hypothetical protein